MSPPATVDEWQAQRRIEERFIEALVHLVPREGEEDRRESEHRATLALLRRGLGKQPGEALEMYRFVGELLPAGAGLQQENAYFLVASLFAMHPRHELRRGASKRDGLGGSFAQLRAKEAAGDPARAMSLERRFVTVLNASHETLPDHLRQAISLLRAREISVDYLRLLQDIQHWDTLDRTVQRNWAGAFWASTDSTGATFGPAQITDSSILDFPEDEEV